MSKFQSARRLCTRSVRSTPDYVLLGLHKCTHQQFYTAPHVPDNCRSTAECSQLRGRQQSHRTDEGTTTTSAQQQQQQQLKTTLQAEYRLRPALNYVKFCWCLRIHLMQCEAVRYKICATCRPNGVQQTAEDMLFTHAGCIVASVCLSAFWKEKGLSYQHQSR